MISRKKKLYITQILFLLIGMLILIFTYKTNKEQTKVSTSDKQTKIANKKNQEIDSDVFLDIQYSGIDLSGNRYILKAKKAVSVRDKKELINMNFVSAVFYIKDGTELFISSEEGVYNNKTLDMIFTKNVQGEYNGDKLFSQRAEYSNSKNYFIISDEISVESKKGKLLADKLVFDLKEKTLDISSYENKKVNAQIDLK